MAEKISTIINSRVNSANLALSERRLSEEAEIRTAHLAEIARDVTDAFSPVEGQPEAAEGEPAYTAFRRYIGGSVSAVTEFFGEACPVAKLSFRLAEQDRAVFSASLADRLGHIWHPLTTDDFLPAKERKNKLLRVAYVSNPDTETAYRRMVNSEFSLAKRVGHMEEACREAVEQGGSVILPYRNSTDGTLRVFLNLATKYDLRACIGCRVEKNDSLDYTDYLLFTTMDTGDISFATVKPGGSELRLLVRLKGREAELDFVSAMASAVHRIGGRIDSFDLLTPLREEAVVSIDTDSESAPGILTYLTLFCGGNIMGIYSEV